MGIVDAQPFKAIYALGALSFEVVRLPIWIFKYVTKYGRQHPEYSFRNAFAVRMASSMVWHLGTIHVKTPLPLSPGKEKERFLSIKPGADRYYTGPFSATDDIKPVEIGATWFPAPLTPSSSSTRTATVVLHFHGGAYVVGDGRSDSVGFGAHKLLKHTNGAITHVLSPAYRLSTLPASKTSNPFPAALQDFLTSYLYLLHDLQIPASNILLSGDSAGGNAAIAFTRYLTEYGPSLSLPLPSATILWSPWIHPAESATGDYVRTNPNYSTDYLSRPLTDWGTLAYAGPAGLRALDSPYISFKGRPFKTDVPIWVNAGGLEVLIFEIKEWVGQMEKEAGNRVVLDVDEGCPHDMFLTGGTLGFDKEVTAVAKRVGAWYAGVRK